MVTAKAPHSLDREKQLVLACAAGDPARVERILSGPVDWTTVTALAVRHGIETLVAQGSLAANADCLPPEIATEMRKHLQQVAARGLNLAGELRRVMAAFHSAQIPVIPYKGPTLAQILYRNMGLRDSVDLDILVRREQVANAREVLRELGYSHPITLSPAMFAAMLDSNCELGMVHSEGILVELQWAFVPHYFPFPVNFEALFARRQVVPLGGGAVHTLGTEDLLVALCVHGAKHQWKRLSWISDVARLIAASPGMDWDLVSRLPGAAPFVELGLALATGVLAAELPPEVRKRFLEDPSLVKRVAPIKQALWRDEINAMWPQLRFCLSMQRGAGAKVATLWRLGMTPNAHDCAMVDLPRSWSFLYYLVRPVRLFQTYVTSRKT